MQSREGGEDPADTLRELRSIWEDPAELADEFVAVGDLERKSIEPDFAEYDRGPVLDRFLDGYRDLLGAD
jgi:hypothetical protein